MVGRPLTEADRRIEECPSHVNVFRDKQTGHLICRDCRRDFGLV